MLLCRYRFLLYPSVALATYWLPSMIVVVTIFVVRNQGDQWCTIALALLYSKAVPTSVEMNRDRFFFFLADPLTRLSNFGYRTVRSYSMALYPIAHKAQGTIMKFKIGEKTLLLFFLTL
jgi:hypothetical protein